MAYTDPTTGVTRDRYGNEVRDPTGTGKPATNYMAWAIGAAIAVALAFAFMNMESANQSTPIAGPDSSATQPVAPKTAP